MFARLWKSFRIGLAAVIAAAPACAAVPSDPPQRIVAVGDLHGDYSVWRDIAGASGLVGRDGHWTGGKAILVQVGDVVDREPDSLKIIRDLMRLQKEAPKAGGRVVALVGNHEAMNVIGDLRYTTAGEYASYATRDSSALRNRVYESRKAEIEAQYRAQDPKITSDMIRAAWMKATPLGWVEQRLAWAPDGEVGRWVLANPAVALIDGNLFVHGGLSAEYSRLTIDQINGQVAAALKALDQSPGSIVSSPLGPLWYRGLLTRDPKITEIPDSGVARPSIQDELGTVLAAYGAKRVIIGHTPILSGIKSFYDGKLFAIDTGNSRYYDGTPSYLEIVGDKVVPHAVQRTPVERGQ